MSGTGHGGPLRIREPKGELIIVTLPKRGIKMHWSVAGIPKIAESTITLHHHRTIRRENRPLKDLPDCSNF